MKSIIQKFLSLFGIRIIRAKYARKYLPKPTIENIKLLAHLYHLSGQKLTLMQVGACDGNWGRWLQVEVVESKWWQLVAGGRKSWKLGVKWLQGSVSGRQ